MTPNELYAIPRRKLRCETSEAARFLGVDLPYTARSNRRIYYKLLTGTIGSDTWEIRTWWYDDKPFAILHSAFDADSGDCIYGESFYTSASVTRAAQQYLRTLMPTVRRFYYIVTVSPSRDRSGLTRFNGYDLTNFVKSKKAKKS